MQKAVEGCQMFNEKSLFPFSSNMIQDEVRNFWGVSGCSTKATLTLSISDSYLSKVTRSCPLLVIPESPQNDH